MREVTTFCYSLYKRVAGIPVGNGFVPVILPILALSAIHTYTVLSVDKHSPPSIHEAILTEKGGHEIKITELQAPDRDTILKNRIKVKPKLSPVLKPEFAAPDITRGNLLKNELSITFDGGSEATGADEILNILRRKNIKTTIFLTGDFIKRYPDIVFKMVEDGHEIGNHTLTHPHLTTFERNFRQQTISGVDKEFVIQQLKETARLFKEITDVDMISYWRAPYGEHNPEIRQWALEAGFTHVGWTTDHKRKETLDTLDWVSDEESEFYHSAEEIKERILNFDKDGSGVKGGIVLMHLGTERKDNHAYTKLPDIIDNLEAHGYRFVKVSELLNK